MVGTPAREADERGHYSSEGVDVEENIWGIVFPEPSESKAGELRRHRRISMRVPVLIRDYSGEVEVTETLDLARGGFSFASETGYQVGETLSVACPYDSGGQNIQLPARIVRWRSIGGGKRTVYGVRYESQAA